MGSALMSIWSLALIKYASYPSSVDGVRIFRHLNTKHTLFAVSVSTVKTAHFVRVAFLQAESGEAAELHGRAVDWGEDKKPSDGLRWWERLKGEGEGWNCTRHAGWMRSASSISGELMEKCHSSDILIRRSTSKRQREKKKGSISVGAVGNEKLRGRMVKVNA